MPDPYDALISASDKLREFTDNLSDDELSNLQFSVPWQYSPDGGGYVDPEDSRVVSSTLSKEEPRSRAELQAECWNKFNRNPQVNTSVRGLAGRIAGMGFETTSEVTEVQKVIEDIETDPRNRLYNYWPKYIARANVEGELFLCFTCHKDGFVEIDFIDPATISEKGDDETGILFHPTKTNMPLFYNVSLDEDKLDDYDQIPSIFIARYPELIKVARKNENFIVKKQKNCKNRKKAFEKFNGFFRFIVSWDKSFITRRATSYLKTTIEWLNYYELLKKYEIDHKRSSGSYIWVFSIESPRDFRLWLSLTDEQKAKTGIVAKKTPGASIVLPPGVKLEVKNPQLAPIRDQDTDIMQMAISGLNEPADVTTGTAAGTYASIKASRGPMSDRISDEIAYFDRFVKHDFWGSIFFLKSQITEFPTHFKRNEAVRFKPAKGSEDGAEPIFENVKRRPEELIDISYPISEIADFDARARGLLGVKHGPVSDTLGIPNRQIAGSLGFGGYGRARLRKATEEENYPQLIYTMDAEALQETLEGNQVDASVSASSTKPGAKAKVKPKPKPKE